MIHESFQWQARSLQHAAHDVAAHALDHRKMQYAHGVRDVLAMLLDHQTPTHPVLLTIYERHQDRLEHLPTPELPGHEWQSGRLTGATTCSKCGLLPLDSDDTNTDCPADAVNRLTETEES